MKKVFALLFGLLITTNAHAVLLDVTPFISNNDVTIAHLEELRADTANVLNGNIEGGGINIKAGSLNTQDFADAVSIVTFRDEAFNDFTFSGMLPATDSDLSSDISAGVSYVKGFRISKNAESRTYTASKDSYVYIHKDGYYVVSEVANGASAPSTPVNTLLLAKVVTSGTAITSVSDLRTTSIQITTTTTNFPANYRSGAFISWDSTTAVHHEAGEVAIGTTIYTRTTDTSSKTLSTGSNWIEGTAPSLTSPIKVYTYAFNDSGSTWDFKYSSQDPVYTDTSNNNAGVLRYYTTGGVYYRALGWAYISADAVQSYNVGNLTDVGVKNFVTRRSNTYRALTAVSIPNDDSIPTNTEGSPLTDFDIVIVPTSANSTIKVRALPHISTSGATNYAAVTMFRNAETSATEVSTNLTNDVYPILVPLESTFTAGSINPIRLSFRAGNNGPTTLHFNGNSSSGARLYGGSLVSEVEVEEILG